MTYKGFKILEVLDKGRWFAGKDGEVYLFNTKIISNITSYSAEEIDKLCYFTSEQHCVDTIDYIYKYNPEELL